ncbi:Uma2 family endonuclease [Streptomyces sp. NPDC052013]|uniref:Uma2 family endonuclease n=1 Tax=Streptomyces sp. NPDC052013 TaxID=3365679 RepID=UPI0037D029E1
MTYDPISQRLLLEWFAALDTPEGFRAELIEGEFVRTPLPDGSHAHCLSGIVSQMYTRSRTDMTFSGNKGLRLGTLDGCPQDHAVPDGTFVPSALRVFRGAEPWMPCEGVALVIEVTCTKPGIDREIKPRCYARGGIPLCLLVDREASSVTLFSDPEKDDYRQLGTRPLGKPLALPEPFGFDLDTADFL